MNIDHLTNNELGSMVGNGLADKLDKTELLELVDDLLGRFGQLDSDLNDILDDIKESFSEFEGAYASVSADITNDCTDEYNDELKQLKTAIMDAEG